MRRRARRRNATLASRLGIFAVLLFAAFYCLLPICWPIVASTEPAGHQFGGERALIEGLGTARTSRRFRHQRRIFGRWMLNSVFYTGTAALIGTVISAIAEYAIAESEFHRSTWSSG